MKHSRKKIYLYIYREKLCQQKNGKTENFFSTFRQATNNKYKWTKKQEESTVKSVYNNDKSEKNRDDAYKQHTHTRRTYIHKFTRISTGGFASRIRMRLFTALSSHKNFCRERREKRFFMYIITVPIRNCIKNSLF